MPNHEAGDRAGKPHAKNGSGIVKRFMCVCARMYMYTASAYVHDLSLPTPLPPLAVCL